jgi:hypothetical protein
MLGRFLEVCLVLLSAEELWTERLSSELIQEVQKKRSTRRLGNLVYMICMRFTTSGSGLKESYLSGARISSIVEGLNMKRQKDPDLFFEISKSLTHHNTKIGFPGPLLLQQDSAPKYWFLDPQYLPLFQETSVSSSYLA